MKCPICKSVDIRKDFDYPETMMNCKICGSEWVIDKSGNCEEITLNSKTDV